MMMKIHTTQNLSSLVQDRHSTNNLSSKNFRFDYSQQLPVSNNVSFSGKKKPAIEDGKKLIKATKKLVGEISKEPHPELKKYDKSMDSKWLNKILSVAENETLTTATIAAVACVLRAMTIGVLPAKDENTKMNNNYAMGHALASGATGFIVAFLLTSPFKHGAKYVKTHMIQSLKTQTLARRYPQLDLNSIGTENARKALKEWKNKDGLDFCDELKKVDLLPKFKQLADVSEKTFMNVLNIKNIDWASQKGKSFNDAVLKDGTKLYDKISMSKLGIVVKEEGMPDAQILLKDIDKEYLTKLINDSKGDKNSLFHDLDINSVYDSNNKVKDFRTWKKASDGKQFMLDLDRTSVASPYEIMSTYKPRISGEKYFDKREKVYKYRTFQINGKDGQLGTKISDAMLESEGKNEVLDKALTWGPDLLFRIPVAMSTVALIPWMLKHAVGLEKNPNKSAKAEVATESKTEKVNQSVENKDAKVAFKSDPNKKANWFIRKLAEWYGKPLLDSERVSNLVSHLTKLPGRTTQHMTVAGSALTSGMYFQQTRKKKDLDPEKRKTLSYNQLLCFFIPTVCAYTVNHFLNDFIKNKEYQYSGIQQRKIDLLRLENKNAEAEKVIKGLGTKLKGVRILADLITFTLIYRYVVPVGITPIANRIGDWVNSRNREKAEKEKANTQSNINYGMMDVATKEQEVKHSAA